MHHSCSFGARTGIRITGLVASTFRIPAIRTRGPETNICLEIRRTPPPSSPVLPTRTTAIVGPATKARRPSGPDNFDVRRLTLWLDIFVVYPASERAFDFPDFSPTLLLPSSFPSSSPDWCSLTTRAYRLEPSFESSCGSLVYAALS